MTNIKRGLSLIELVLTVAFLALVIDLGVAVYFAKRAKLAHIIEKVEEYLDNWKNAGGLDQYIWQEDGEWKCDERIGVAIDFVGSRLAHSLRQAMFQQMGVDRKLEKHVDKALSLDMLDNSGIGGILELLGMGNTKKILANNPKTLGLILQRVSPLLGKYLQGQGQAQTGKSDFGWNP